MPPKRTIIPRTPDNPFGFPPAEPLNESFNIGDTFKVQLAVVDNLVTRSEGTTDPEKKLKLCVRIRENWRAIQGRVDYFAELFEAGEQMARAEILQLEKENGSGEDEGKREELRKKEEAEVEKREMREWEKGVEAEAKGRFQGTKAEGKKAVVSEPSVEKAEGEKIEAEKAGGEEARGRKSKGTQTIETGPQAEKKKRKRKRKSKAKQTQASEAVDTDTDAETREDDKAASDPNESTEDLARAMAKVSAQSVRLGEKEAEEDGAIRQDSAASVPGSVKEGEEKAPDSAAIISEDEPSSGEEFEDLLQEESGGMPISEDYRVARKEAIKARNVERAVRKINKMLGGIDLRGNAKARKAKEEEEARTEREEED